MLLPKKTKFRKYQRGRRRGTSKGQTTVQAGDFGLKALEVGWITNRQIEAARIAMTRKIRRGGEVWINVFPDKPGKQKACAECRVQPFPGKAVYPETRRDADGLRQGRPGALGRRRQARPRDVRAGRRRRVACQGGAAPRGAQAADQDEGRFEGGGSLCELESCATSPTRSWRTAWPTRAKSSSTSASNQRRGRSRTRRG